jgi:hypothetical protein
MVVLWIWLEGALERTESVLRDSVLAGIGCSVDLAAVACVAGLAGAFAIWASFAGASCVAAAIAVGAGINAGFGRWGEGIGGGVQGQASAGASAGIGASSAAHAVRSIEAAIVERWLGLRVE